MNIKQITKKIAAFSILPLAVLTTTIAIPQLSTSALFTPTGLGIVPTNPDPSKPPETSWFVSTMKPGETKEFSADIINNGDKDMEIEVRPKDAIQTSNGSFSFRNTEEQDTGAATWIKLPKNEVSLKADSLYTLKYTLTVPNDAKAGEYAAVIAVNEKPETSKSAVKVVSRVGARVYITVPGDLKSGVDVQDFNFMQPASKDYPAFVKSRPNQPFDDLFIGFNLQNTGNVFTKIKGDIKITTPDGDKTITVDRDIAPESGNIFALNPVSGTKWKVGKYKAVFEYENTPINNKDAKNITTKNRVETEINMTQDILDQMKSDAESVKKKTVGGTKNDEVEANNFEVVSKISDKKEESKEVKTEEKNNTPVYVASGVVATAIIGGVIFVVAKKKKKDEKEESKEVKTEEKTDTNK